MSANADLAGWGEPPATPDEEKLASELDEVLAKLERGKVVTVQSLKRDTAEIKERGQRQIQAASSLFHCAAIVWENSSAENPASGSDRYPTLDVRDCPDPFPGEFRLRGLLGEGAFGKVWLADDLKLGRQVALKTLKLPAASTLGPQVLTALRTEAQHLAQLEHANIVRVHAWREAEGEYYLVLQFVAGGSLADRLKNEKALGWQDAARYVADVGEALVEAHKRGVIHRDIKPDNILWDAARNEAMLTDFGVSARLAEPGTAAGTPIYMAPEAFEGHISPALDVYSLAATFFRLVTGEFPFEKASRPGLVQQKLKGLRDPDPRCKAMPEALERIIRAGLAGKPADRPNMADFVAVLRGSLNQLLADALGALGSGAPTGGSVNLHLVVSRRVEGNTYELVAAKKPSAARRSRDMKKVPAPPAQVRLRTGDWVRIEVIADQLGYLTVFNIGPTGNLNLLYPDDFDVTLGPPLAANKPLHVLDVELTPPIGRERLVALWSRARLPLNPKQLQSMAEGGDVSGSRPYRATRDMKRVEHSVEALRPDEWRAVVLELDQVT